MWRKRKYPNLVIAGNDESNDESKDVSDPALPPSWFSDDSPGYNASFLQVAKWWQHEMDAPMLKANLPVYCVVVNISDLVIPT